MLRQLTFRLDVNKQIRMSGRQINLISLKALLLGIFPGLHQRLMKLFIIKGILNEESSSQFCDAFHYRRSWQIASKLPSQKERKMETYSCTNKMTAASCCLNSKIRCFYSSAYSNKNSKHVNVTESCWLPLLPRKDEKRESAPSNINIYLFMWMNFRDFSFLSSGSVVFALRSIKTHGEGSVEAPKQDVMIKVATSSH